VTQFESARSKKVDPDMLPTVAPMKQGGAIRAPKITRAPSSDQKKVRRLQNKTSSVRTGCRGCGDEMVVAATEGWPLCAGCTTGEEAREPGQDTTLAMIAGSVPYQRGYERGRVFGDSFISTDAEHPWNSMPELRTRMAAQHMGNHAHPSEYGKFLSGFVKGVEDVQHKTATVLNTGADRLQPGDRVLGPTGQTVTIKRTRNHETNNKKVYVDTDAGTTLVDRSHAFQLAPHNTTQQETPGFGVPGANTNTNPFSRSPGASNQETSGTCPNCGGKGTMARRGGQYICSRCGYKEQTGPLGEGANLLDSERTIQTFTSLAALDDNRSAIARRAQQMLATMEES
jgi:ribosomal protein L37AE/L43A